jgi:hypothetical protein
MSADLSHDAAMELLANPSTQNILEKLGYEYSDRGLAEYRKTRPNIVPALVQAIVRELRSHPVFPTRFEIRLPDCGFYIYKQGDDFVLMDMEKPSIWTEQAFPTREGAARGYVRKLLDSYWLRSDTENTILPKSVRHS